MRERCRNSKKQKEKIEMYVSHKKWQIRKKIVFVKDNKK